MKNQELNILNFIIILIFVGIISAVLFIYNYHQSEELKIQSLNSYFQNLQDIINSAQNNYYSFYIKFNPPVNYYIIKIINNTLYFYYPPLNYNYTINFGNLSIYIMYNNETFQNNTFYSINNGNIYFYFINNYYNQNIQTYSSSQSSNKQNNQCNNIPQRFTWENYIGNNLPLNQLDCGGCWAFATAGLLTIEYNILTNGTFNHVFSPEELIECCNSWTSPYNNIQYCEYTYGCNGGSFLAGGEFVENVGLYINQTYPINYSALFLGIPNLTYPYPSCYAQSINSNNYATANPNFLDECIDTNSLDQLNLNSIPFIPNFLCSPGPDEITNNCELEESLLSSPLEASILLFAVDQNGNILVFGGHAMVLVGYSLNSQTCEKLFNTPDCYIFLNSWGSPGIFMIEYLGNIIDPYNDYTADFFLDLTPNGYTYLPINGNLTYFEQNACNYYGLNCNEFQYYYAFLEIGNFTNINYNNI